MRGNKISVFILFPHHFAFSLSFMLLSSLPTLWVTCFHRLPKHIICVYFLFFHIPSRLTLCFHFMAMMFLLGWLGIRERAKYACYLKNSLVAHGIERIFTKEYTKSCNVESERGKMRWGFSWVRGITIIIIIINGSHFHGCYFFA